MPSPSHKPNGIGDQGQQREFTEQDVGDLSAVKPSTRRLPVRARSVSPMRALL